MTKTVNSCKQINLKPLCVSLADAQNIYNQIKSVIEQNQKVELSFKNVEVLLPVFIIASIGQLYGEFNENHIDKYLVVKNISFTDLILLEKSIANTKKYYCNQNAFDTAWEQNNKD